MFTDDENGCQTKSNCDSDVDYVITESDRLIWKNEKYNPGVPGIINVIQDKFSNTLNVYLVRGNYNFSLKEM